MFKFVEPIAMIACLLFAGSIAIGNQIEARKEASIVDALAGTEELVVNSYTTRAKMLIGKDVKRAVLGEVEPWGADEKNVLCVTGQGGELSLHRLVDTHTDVELFNGLSAHHLKKLTEICSMLLGGDKTHEAGDGRAAAK